MGTREKYFTTTTTTITINIAMNIILENIMRNVTACKSKLKCVMEMCVCVKQTSTWYFLMVLLRFVRGFLLFVEHFIHMC